MTYSMKKSSGWIKSMMVLVIGVAGLVQSATASAVWLNSRAQLSGMAQTQVDWSALGPDGTAAGATPTVGPITASGPSSFAAFTQAPTGSYDADFLPGEALLAMFDLVNGNATSGMITLDLAAAGITGFGFQLTNAIFGAFSVDIAAYDASGLIGTNTYNGTSSNLQDGSALFVGMLNDGGSISRITISGLAEGSAIGNVSLVPVPGTWLLVALGLFLLAATRRQRA